MDTNRVKAKVGMPSLTLTTTWFYNQEFLDWINRDGIGARWARPTEMYEAYPEVILIADAWWASSMGISWQTQEEDSDEIPSFVYEAIGKILYETFGPMMGQPVVLVLRPDKDVLQPDPELNEV